MGLMRGIGVVILVLLAACGGGGSSDDAQAPVADPGASTGSTPSTPTSLGTTATTTLETSPASPDQGSGTVGTPTIEADLANCARQQQVAAEQALQTNLAGAAAILAEWERSGCAAACGPIATPTAQTRCSRG